MLTEPVIALTVEFVAIVTRMSVLVFWYSCNSQFFAIRFAFISSSRVMPPLTVAANTTDKPPDKTAATGMSASDEFFVNWRNSTDLMLSEQSCVSWVEGWLYTLLATSLERVSHPVKPIKIKTINVNFEIAS